MATNRFASRNDDRQRVLDATDIVALIGEHLSLHAKGREYVALCPFHDDHKPSMTVSPQKQIFKCFSCGAGGNAFDFMMRYHGMDFRETLQRLADHAGVALTPFKPDPGAPRADDGAPTRDDIARANEFALEFFRSILRHPEHGRPARDAVAGRDFTDETIDEFRIGAAPNRWDGLLLTVRKHGLSEEHFLATGLLKRSDEGKLYDALRNRVIFPILDQVGRPIAFGARRINEDDEPKYLNSPETALFDKSSTLFGLGLAARAIQSKRRAIVVEGYTDAIACRQAGVHNAVATLGTALTARHANALQRLCDRVTLLFDADDAGLKAADRGVEVFFASSVDVQIAVLPDGADPADLLSTEDGRERFDEIIERAEDALAFRFRRLGDQLRAAGVSARAKAVERDVERLVELGLGAVAPIRRRLIIRNYADLIGVEEGLVIQAIERAIDARRRRETLAEPKPGDTRSAPLGPFEHALGCLLADPTLIHNLAHDDLALLDPDAAPDDHAAAIARAVHERAAQPDPGALSGAIDAIEDPQTRALAACAALEAERVTDHDRDRLREHLLDCLRQWRRRAGRVKNHADIRSTSAGPGHSIPDPDRGTGDEGTDEQTATEHDAANASDDIHRLGELIEARRKIHHSTGGDPLTLPRPIAP